MNVITLCFNINGCPNRCRHCYLNGKPSKRMDMNTISEYVQKFKEEGYKINVSSWYLEPDFPSDYKELYEWEQEQSVKHIGHFELASDFRLVRDNEYVKWLKEVGVKKVQLTFFGLEDLTNYYTNRKNAFNELLESIDILIDNEITPRIQYFVYQDTIKELNSFVKLIDSLKLEDRCKEFGSEFELFIHQGGCTGRAIKLYDNWMRKEDIKLIPDYVLKKMSQFHNTDKPITSYFGVTEKELVNKLSSSNEYYSFEPNYIFYIDENYNVFTNFGEPTSNWMLGNLNNDSLKDIINKYEQGIYPAANLCKKYTIGELVNEAGDKGSNKLFNEDSYIEYLIDKVLLSN